MFLFNGALVEIDKKVEGGPGEKQDLKTLEATFTKVLDVNKEKIIKMGGDVKNIINEFSENPTMENAERLLEPYGLYEQFKLELQKLLEEQQKSQGH